MRKPARLRPGKLGIRLHQLRHVGYAARQAGTIHPGVKERTRRAAMKRILLAVLGMALFPVLETAQEQGWAAKFFPAGLTHTFGTIAYGSVQTHKFTITNIYNVPFQVTEARVSCGCVDAKRPAI